MNNNPVNFAARNSFGGLRQRWTRPKRLIPITLLLLVAIGIIGLKLFSRSALERELAAIRAQGLPTNPIELDRWYAHVPASSNAALKLLEAYSFYEPAKDPSPGSFAIWKLPHDAPLSDAAREALVEHVENNEDALKLMREAALMRQSRYPIDLSKAPEVPLHHLSQIRKLMDLANYEAVLKAEQSNTSGALEALNCGFAISDSLAREPLLISELVRMACLGIQSGYLERCITRLTFDDSQLQQLILMVRTIKDQSRHALHRALIGERAFANTGRNMTYDDYVTVASFGGGSWFSDEWPEFANRSLYNVRQAFGVNQRDLAFYFASLGRLIGATDPPNPNYVGTTDKIIDEITTDLNERPYFFLLSKVSLPNMLVTPRGEATENARLRCAEMALQIERFRLHNNGRLPRADQLVPAIFPELPRDPFDNSPLQYELLPKGYRIIAAAATAHERRNRTNAPPVAFTVLR